MRLIAAALILVVTCAVPALADELPSRKPGLWQVTTSIENRNGPAVVIQQCIDAATDQMMQSSAGPYSQQVCPKRSVQKSANSMTIDSACTIAGKAATAHAVITGSFDRAYSMTVTSQSEDLPGGKMIMTVAAEWLGPCAADQKPGDVIMANGMKANILDLQKRAPSSGIPVPPR